MPLEYWLCVVSVILWLFIAAAISEYKHDVSHPAVIFLILFVVTYPLKLILSFHGFQVLDSMSVDQSIILKSILVFNLGATVFIMPLILQSRIKIPQEGHRIRGFSAHTSLSIAVILLIIAHGPDAFFSIFSQEGLQNRIIERPYERVGSGLVKIFGSLSLFFLMIFATKYITNGGSIVKAIPVITVYSLFALLISGSKYHSLVLPLIFAMVFHYYQLGQGREAFKFKHIFIGSILMLITVGLLGYVRGAGAWSDELRHPFLLQSFYQLSNAFDAPDNLIVLLDRADDWFVGEIGLRLWGDYMLFPFIPRFIWEGKPLVQGNQLIMQHFFPERFNGHLGEAISPSFPGEMILTGGMIYFVLWTLLLGILVGKLYKLALVRGGLYFISYIWVNLNMFNFMRSGTGMIGSLVFFLIISCFAYFILRVIFVASRKSES